MKIGILFSTQYRQLEQTAKHLGRILESTGNQVEYIPLNTRERPPSLRKFDIIYLGSLTEGMFGGKIPNSVTDAIKQYRGFENSKSVAFILKRMFGNVKGMKRLMAVLESMGSQVMDFQTIGGKADIEALGERLKSYK